VYLSDWKGKSSALFMAFEGVAAWSIYKLSLYSILEYGGGASDGNISQIMP
jgi:hypothetical protein